LLYSHEIHYRYFLLLKFITDKDEGLGSRNGVNGNGRVKHNVSYDQDRNYDQDYDYDNDNGDRCFKRDNDDDRSVSSRRQDYRRRRQRSIRTGRMTDNDADYRYSNGKRTRDSRSYEEDDDVERYRKHRERSDSAYYSDEYDDSRRHERSRFASDKRSSRPSDSFRRQSIDDADCENNGRHEEEKNEKNLQKEPKEWPPSFKNNGSLYTFDARSAMFYEPLSDFFYDPKSKLYYGNKKCAYFRYDEKKEPPFVEVQKMTSEQLEEQRGVGGGISQVKVVANSQASMIPSIPKIAIKLKTKKVKSSLSTLASIEGTNYPTPATVSKVKQKQIANIGKWTEKQAELKQAAPNSAVNASAGINLASDGVKEKGPRQSKSQVRTTAKGEPICLVCKRKFPNLEKLRLHEKGSELHKKNLLKLQEKNLRKEVGTKRKIEEKIAAASNPIANQSIKSNTAHTYTDRAEKRRQLHGADLSAPANGLPSLRRLDDRPGIPSSESSGEAISNIPGNDTLDYTNLGHQMLQKMGYQFEPPSAHFDQQNHHDTDSCGKPKTTNDHLRKEWDRIEAMAAKGAPRNR